ncbi:AraC family transcriptional regulator [Komagataeibacter medellinensis]|uniref:Transcriptional regulator n=1 Tax=Komagataeibacter medellinensis (strain NBRC 3288 / BCRC 11682 / LMG 1693 / Kondo 51) TaxID=634177 RepID=G2I1F9_KOMMN|nr:helix-turn-helix transcriptional regulator [Komagataeibacter medellinensis]BAK84767.1 transcriptional regulator [Komagataeibacter medellinensis NBRC 3288]
MPILSDRSTEQDWIEPDEVPRRIVAYGYAFEHLDKIELEFHCHVKSQIMMVQSGALSCEVEGGFWIVPPHSAIWIPGGARHTVYASGVLKGYNAFIDPAASPAALHSCRAIAITPLLRELLARTAALPLFYETTDAITRMQDVLLDELAAAAVENLHLPMPRDMRVRKIVDRMIEVPSEQAPMTVWASQAGLSTRTLSRLILRETGMSFSRWRQQLCVMLAIKWLATGMTIQQVANALGYESVPSFVTMFRNVLGAPPGRYMAERYSKTGPIEN